MHRTSPDLPAELFLVAGASVPGAKGDVGRRPVPLRLGDVQRPDECIRVRVHRHADLARFLYVRDRCLSHRLSFALNDAYL